MKKLLFCCVGAVAACCHGGLFDSALKTVNKAAEVVNAVDDARKPPAEAPQAPTPQSPIVEQQPQEAAPQSPVVAQQPQNTALVNAKDMPWDATGYQARVAKVNEAMPKVAPKLPLSGELNEWYNAAYGLTTTECQYGFLPPAQRVARISEDNRIKIDKFIGWVDGGMQVFDSVKDEADKQREKHRIAEERAAEARRLANEKEAEEARLAAEENKRVCEKENDERKRQAELAEAAAIQEQSRRAQAEQLQKDDFTLRNKIDTALGEFYGYNYRENHVVSKSAENKLKEVSENFKKDLASHGYDSYKLAKEYVTSEYIEWLKGAVAQCEGQLAKIKEEIESETQKIAPVLKYVKDSCSRDEWIRGEGVLTPEHKAEILKLLDGVSQQELAQCVREREDEMLFIAAQLITDQKVLEDILVTNTQWVKGGYRNGMDASDFRIAYYKLYRNITDQELLMKLWKQKEISFSTDGDSYGYKDPILLKLFDKAHIKTLNRQRIARRRAVQGKTIDVLGFYIGMPRQDYELLRFMRGLTDDDLMGNFGTFKIGQANRFRMSKKFTSKFLGIKDGISDLSSFTSKFVPGGEKAAGKIQAYGDIRKTYDIERENVDINVDEYWWRSCPKLSYPSKIKLYAGGTMVIVADDTDVKLDLSAADTMMNEDFDETKLDRSKTK